MGKTNAVFVYGTLQRGQLRASMWPCEARQIEPARIRAALYDLGSYPAIVPGDDWVGGEIWTFDVNDMQETLAVLDSIECYHQDESDLYVRHVVDCETLGQGERKQAFAYFYADESELTPDRRILASKDGICRWPANQ